MARESFIDKRFGAAAMLAIEQANAILAEYHAKGFTMTLRQLHYQFVSRDLYKNTQQNYKRLGNIMSDARLAGLVDWDMMEDRLRSLASTNAWSSPASIIDAVADQYKEDLWAGQAVRPEVWIEKDALAGVIEGVCFRHRVPYFACRGYVSQSAQYEASKRFLRYRSRGQEPIVFHLGDHDPSGIDMTRENREKFRLLTGDVVKVERLALNIDQVRHYNPPPNFAKTTDSRAAEYIAEFGDESWELDALSPEVFEMLIEEAILPLINKRKWKDAEKAEAANKKRLQSVSNNWDEVVSNL